MADAKRHSFSETLASLLEPRRLLPIVLVCSPLVVAQGALSSDRFAIPLGVAMCAAFVVIAPHAYRALFLDAPPRAMASELAAMAAYVMLAATVVVGLAVGVPSVTGMGHTFLTSPTSIAICSALFAVGGWGLARDIDLEAKLGRARRREEELSRAAERAQLLAIRANFDPHFLFNTLNAIAEWCRTDGEVAEKAILKLSAMLRTVQTGVTAPSWPLERELSLVRALFDLYLVRSPSAFTLKVDVDESLASVLLPPLMVLPLAENAMKHGPSAGFGGEVLLRVCRSGDDVSVVVENPGPFRGPRAGSQGLPTIERRLALAYDSRATLSVAPIESTRTRATLTLPIRGPIADEGAS